ncbi:MAG: Rne/Rng family ribonuclease, partial [Desulfuromonadaceae bacterium]|nr:Rne/Rng family ribonuclease [Desulfuromonadaceae bacterium]
VTTELSLAGRYMVLMANSRSRGISRKIEKDSTRKKIKEALKELDLPDEMGYIIRTAAIDQPPEELKRDFNYLFNNYKNIITQAESATAPALIYQESSLVLRSVRDYFTPDMDEVLIDDKEVFKQTREFFKTVMPDQVNLVKLHQERRPIFSRYQIEEQIAQLTSNSVTLPSGGSIVLDQTEALVAIDVNSGKVSSEQNIEATACLVNVEAATEIARQLRLRDLGGLIVIDFIDMRQRKNARKVEKTLELALKQDKARVTQGRISTLFGLLEMSRQRIKPNLGAASYSNCPHCNGTGLMRSSESRAISLLRRIQAGTAKGKIEKVVATVALDVGTTLLNEKRSELRDLELQQHVKVWINPRPDFLSDQVELDFIKDAGEQENGPYEQKALVDVNFADRSRDFDFSDTAAAGFDAETDDSAAAKQPDGKDSTTDSTKNPTGEGQEAPPQPKHPRRSRPSRHRRSRSNTNERSKENTEQSAQTDVKAETPSEASQLHSSGTDHHTTQKDVTQHTDATTVKSAHQNDGANSTSSAQPIAMIDAANTSAATTTSSGEDASTEKNTEAKVTEAAQTKSAPVDAEVEKPKRRRPPRRPAAKKKEAGVLETDAVGEKKPQPSDATPAKPVVAPAKLTAVKETGSAASTVTKPASVTDTAPASAPDAEPAPQTAKPESAPVEKTAPERKRRTTARSSATRRSTSPKEADTPVAKEPEAEKATEVKKTPRRRTTAARSKATASKVKTGTDTGDMSATDTAPAAPSKTTEEKTAVKRAPRRTTARRKPAAAKTDAAETNVVKADASAKDTPAAEASKPAQNSQPPRETAAPVTVKNSEGDA